MASTLDILVRARDEATTVIKGVGTAATGLGTQVQTVTTRTSQASVAIQGWVDKMKAFFGIAAGVEFAKKSLEAFDNLEKGVKTLEVGLDKIHQPQALDDITTWASGFADDTGIIQSDLITVAARLTNMGQAFFKAVGPEASTALENLVGGFEDMAAATGKNVTMLMRSLGPAILNAPDKAITVLQKYGVLTDQQAAKIKALTDAGQKEAATLAEINAIQAKFGGTAAKTATAYDKLGERLNKVEVFAGGLISQGLAPLIPLLDVAEKNATLLLTAFVGYKVLPVVLRGVDAAVNAMTGDISILTGEMGSLTTTTEGATGAIVAEGDAAVASGAKSAAFGASLLTAVKGPLPYILALVQGFQDLQTGLHFGGADDVSTIADALASGALNAKDLKRELDAALSSVGGNSDALALVKDHTAELDDLLRAAGIDVGRFGVNGKAAYDTLRAGLDKYLGVQHKSAEAGISSMQTQGRAAMEVTRSLDLLVGRGVAGADSMESLASGADQAAFAEQRLRVEQNALNDALRTAWSLENQAAGGLLGLASADSSAAQAKRDLAAADAKVNRLTAAGKQGTAAYTQAVRDRNAAEINSIQAQQGVESAAQSLYAQFRKGNVTLAEADVRLRAQARAAGLSAGETNHLVDRVNALYQADRKIPHDVTTNFHSNVQNEMSALVAYWTKLKSIPTHIDTYVTVHYQQTGNPTTKGPAI